MRLLVLIFLIVSFSTEAVAGEKWECTDPSGSNVLVIAEAINPSPSGAASKGKIIVAETTQRAVYYVQGFNRRWDFGPIHNGKYDYAFVITPSGSGMYFDFTNAINGQHVLPSMSYECTKYKRETAAEKKKAKKELDQLMKDIKKAK